MNPEGQYFLCWARNWASARTSLSIVWTGVMEGMHSMLGGMSRSKLTTTTWSEAGNEGSRSCLKQVAGDLVAIPRCTADSPLLRTTIFP